MITILCSGSRGDYQPYIALALELKKIGLPVIIVGGKSFEDFVTGYGVDFYPLTADYLSADLDQKFIKQAQSADNPVKMLLAFNKMKGFIDGMTDEMYEACAGSQLVVYHPGCAIGYFAAENMGIPSVLAAPFPMHKTKEVASVIAYGHQKIPTALSYTLLQGMLWMAAKSSAVTVLKKRLGRLPKNFGCPFERVDQQHPAVVSCSNAVFKRPRDWNENIHQSGYWFIDKHTEYTPPEELSGFLSSGEKPVYFGFGSVFHEDEKEGFIKIISEALTLTNRRGLISGMGHLEHLPENMLSVGSLPHTWLFKRVSAVCHHGGAGTTAAGFQAGVPSIIIPFSNDQFAWAYRSYDLGVGTKPLHRKKLNARGLAEAIIMAHSYPVETSARKLAEDIAAENGARDCARVIAKILER
jgi:sterol 3beta-glucosyltransferase